ncbi:hypothetical protein A6770_40440 [Nostoc minutum NIES-26]|uniref:Uncharacterized protein n=1 Tax=Nostoc minutum NIES-26 TaxID=1844469 RepID=A0A367RKG2_9NOSO|nr:hypothetical protein A6770_40440 [Nostoc minutum NIES-26]
MLTEGSITEATVVLENKAIAPPVCASDRLVVTSAIQYSSFSYALTDAGLSYTNAQTRSLPSQERLD